MARGVSGDGYFRELGALAFNTGISTVTATVRALYVHCKLCTSDDALAAGTARDAHAADAQGPGDVPHVRARPARRARQAWSRIAPGIRCPRRLRHGRCLQRGHRLVWRVGRAHTEHVQRRLQRRLNYASFGQRRLNLNVKKLQ